MRGFGIRGDGERESLCRVCEHLRSSCGVLATHGLEAGAIGAVTATPAEGARDGARLLGAPRVQKGAAARLRLLR